MRDITKEKNGNRKIDGISLLALITLIIATVGGIPGLISTWDYLFSEPDLEVTPFHKNDTLYFHIYNKGDKTALISESQLVFFSEDGNICYKGWTMGDYIVFGKPLEIPSGESKIISTGYDIPRLKELFISMNSANKWGVSLHEKSIGWPVYIFYGEPSGERDILSSGYTDIVTVKISQRLFSIDARLENDLSKSIVSEELKNVFKTNGFSLSDNATITKRKENEWVIADEEKFFIRKEDENLSIYILPKSETTVFTFTVYRS